jgi:segregation and condensation protein A
MADEAGRFARSVTLEPQLAGLLPEVLLGLGPEEFAALAARAFAPKPVPYLSIEHLHTPAVSVREQAAILVTMLRRSRSSTFRQLTVDCEGTLVVVARFLALLELFAEGAVAFEQIDPLGELHIRWTGTDEGEVEVPDEFDEDVVVAAEEPVDDDLPADDQPDTIQPDTTIDLRETSTDDHA